MATGAQALEEAVSQFSQLTVASLQSWRDKGATIFEGVVTASVILWLPPGFVCAERTLAGPLCYGMHKCFFTSGGGALEDIKTITEWKEQGGGKPGSMKQIMELMVQSN